MVHHHQVRCRSCGNSSRLVAAGMPVCLDCIRSRYQAALPHIDQAHARSRSAFGLPIRPPDQRNGVRCTLCGNQCRIPNGARGFCGLRENVHGRLVSHAGTSRAGLVSWYYDPLPTNCVADWVCPGGSAAGYPDYSHAEGPEYGHENLAVFYAACSFNCLFCQNWHFREKQSYLEHRRASEVAGAVRDTTACICYFGGDPTPQLRHSLSSARQALKRAHGRILRICWETNGSMHPRYLAEMAAIACDSGGCIKFDLKAFDDRLHRALCGVSNRQTLDNLAWLAQYARRRPDPPLLVASTLLVPGYIDAQEVSQIVSFLAALDRSIPYTLLAFYPCFYLHDLPRTSHRHAQEAMQAARDAGLERVRVGNAHLLSDDY